MRIVRTPAASPTLSSTLSMHDNFDADREVAIQIAGPDRIATTYLNVEALIALRDHLHRLLAGQEASGATYHIETD